MANKYKVLLILMLFVAGLKAQERQPVPASVGYVNDFAGLLSADERSTLEQRLKAYEDSTSTQIAIVIEATLNGRDKFDRAMDFGRGWQVGQAGKNNGVVLYIAVQEHAIFILTADKTQGELNDGTIGEIIWYDIAPEFKRGQYFTGISNGVTSIIAALGGEFHNDHKNTGRKGIGSYTWIIILILIILSIFSRRGGRGSGGYSGRGTYWFPTGGGSWGGGSSSGGGWGGFGGGGGFNGGGAGGNW